MSPIEIDQRFEDLTTYVDLLAHATDEEKEHAHKQLLECISELKESVSVAVESHAVLTEDLKRHKEQLVAISNMDKAAHGRNQEAALRALSFLQSEQVHRQAKALVGGK